jgi:hypothetical protein
MLLIAVICITVAAVIQFWRDQPDAVSIDGRDQARLFHPGYGATVRTRLSAGGNWIRTSSTRAR